MPVLWTSLEILKYGLQLMSGFVIVYPPKNLTTQPGSPILWDNHRSRRNARCRPQDYMFAPEVYTEANIRAAIKLLEKFANNNAARRIQQAFKRKLEGGFGIILTKNNIN